MNSFLKYSCIYGYSMHARVLLMLAIMTVAVSGCGRADSAVIPIVTQTQLVQTQEAYPVPPVTVVTLPTVAIILNTASLGIVIDQELKVIYVEPHSGAQSAGVQVGDVVNTLNDIPIVGHVADLKALIVTSPKDQKLRLKVNRSGKDLDIDVPLRAPQYDNPNPGKPIPTQTAVPQLQLYL